MKYSLILLLMMIQLVNTNAQNILYESGKFKIYSDRCVQDKYTSTAVSEYEFVSDISGQWKLQKNISQFPSYKSPHMLVNALYNKAIEEMLMNIRDDGAFMAGEKWTGVWTRDISYSIILSLAIIAPDASKTSLMAKVKDGIIIQDTGTGGAWPVSSDRMIWALAAWEIFKVTGDKQWLRDSYNIIKKSAEADTKTIEDPATGLFRGESSFLDWREQTYPRWMDPKDIYMSLNLGTNAIHYQTYVILSDMAGLLGQKDEYFSSTAKSLKSAINKYLWQEEKGYYGQYIYGRNRMSLSSKSEALGEALTVLFGVADNQRSKRIISSTPVTEFGVPCTYPWIPGIPPYHNDAVWPFVASYYGWAASKTGNFTAVENAMASVYRPAALFGTNKENLVASTGHFTGTEINSDRQLWSVAGNLAMVYRIIFGMSFESDKLVLSPFVPRSYAGHRSLDGFVYRDMNLSIEIEGYGNEIKRVYLDNMEIKKAVIPANMKGKHILKIVMSDKITDEGSLNIVENKYSPETPVVKIEGNLLKWDNVKDAARYIVFLNGEKIKETSDNHYMTGNKGKNLNYQVMAVDKEGWQSFKSEPVILSDNSIVVEMEHFSSEIKSDTSGFSGKGYVSIDKVKNVNFGFESEKEGSCIIDFRYANGNGPINTLNKCAIRDLHVNNERAGVVILPQRGDGIWKDWGYSNPIKIKVKKGNNQLSVSFSDTNNNMNGEINTAFLDCARIIYTDK